MATIGKIIFIAIKVILIAFFLLRGLISHWKQPQKNFQVIGLLLVYLFLLMVITVTEIFYEFVPLIYLILAATSAI